VKIFGIFGGTAAFLILLAALLMPLWRAIGALPIALLMLLWRAIGAGTGTGSTNETLIISAFQLEKMGAIPIR
jgi:hypothetical protein